MLCSERGRVRAVHRDSVTSVGTYFVYSEGKFKGGGAIINLKNSKNQASLDANVKAGSRQVRKIALYSTRG